MDRTQVSLGHREHLEARAEGTGPVVRASQCGWAEVRNWDFLLPAMGGHWRASAGAWYGLATLLGALLATIWEGHPLIQEMPPCSHTPACSLSPSFLHSPLPALHHFSKPGPAQSPVLGPDKAPPVH